MVGQEEEDVMAFIFLIFSDFFSLLGIERILFRLVSDIAVTTRHQRRLFASAPHTLELLAFNAWEYLYLSISRRLENTLFVHHISSSVAISLPQRPVPFQIVPAALNISSWHGIPAFLTPRGKLKARWKVTEYTLVACATGWD